MEQLAQIAYAAFAESLGGQMPSFEHLSARLQDAWCAAAEAVAQSQEKI